MSFALLFVVIAVLGLASTTGVAGFLIGKSRRPVLPNAAHGEDAGKHLDRIELLEAELQRVKDQADFTERLLAERSGSASGNIDETDPTD